MNPGTSTCQGGVVPNWNISCALLVPYAALVCWIQVHLPAKGWHLSGTMHLPICLLFVTTCNPFVLSMQYCHMLVAHDLLYLFYLNNLGLPIFHKYLWHTFSTNLVSVLSSFCIIYLNNMCSPVLEGRFLEVEPSWWVQLYLCTFAQFYIWKWIETYLEI